MATEKLAKLSWILTLQGIAQKADADAASIYKAILLHIVDGFDAKSGCLAVRDPNGEGLRIVAGIDIPQKAIGSEVKLGSGVLGWVAEQGTALLLNGDIVNDPRFPKPVARNDSVRPRSAMCWPLHVNDETVGVVSVNRLEGSEPFDQVSLDQGNVILNLVGLTLSNIRLREEQQRRIEALREANDKLEEAQNQLVQSEKMASVGQLAAGVAHEINNPIGFVNSNLGTLEKYIDQMFGMLTRYEALGAELPQDAPLVAKLASEKEDLTYLREDIPALIHESRDGIDRVRKIVQNLKEFSHVDSADEWQLADLRSGIDNTIGIAWNEIKYKCELKREYADIPLIECLQGQLNQVFLNMLVNASQAMKEKGEIIVRVRQAGSDHVEVDIADNGQGIAPANLARIFDPFFTTKPIGQGTGLGLSISYGIVKKHHGEITVASELGKGTTFTIRLPIAQLKTGETGSAQSWQI